MTQSQFMYDLMVELDGVPDEDKYVLMNDYTQYFNDCIDNGISEELVIKRLQSPKAIAQSYKNGNPIPLDGVESVLLTTQNGVKTVSGVIKFIMLIPIGIIYEVISVVLGFLLLAVTLVLCVIGAFVSVTAFMASALNVGFILLGIGGIFLTFAFVMLCGAVFITTINVVRFFPIFMAGVLKNKARGSN